MEHSFETINELPRPLVWAASRSTYTKEGADFSVTELIGPARISALKYRLSKSGVDLPERAAVDYLFAMIGTGMHRSLEEAAIAAKNAGEEVLVEKRYHISRRHFGEEYTISGQVDYAELTPDGAILCDYKTTSVWAAIYGPKPEHLRQLEIYALLLEESGYKVSEARLCFLLRDWSAGKVGRERNYPESPVVTFRIPLRSSVEIEAYLQGRLWEHVTAREGLMPECTGEERWVRDAKTAIYKGASRKRALRLFDPEDLEGLQMYIEDQKLKFPKSEFYVEHRRGTNTRCERYCEVSEHCSQYHALRAEAALATPEKA